jgi:hypothetical protein
LLRDPALRRRLSQAGRATMAERFCEERIVPMYEAFYEDVLA